MPRLFRWPIAWADQENLFQRPEPVIHVLVDLILGEAVALLQLAFELLAATLDHVEIVVGEFAPLFLCRTLELLPVAFNPVPIHRHLLLRWDEDVTSAIFKRSERNCGIVTSMPAR